MPSNVPALSNALLKAAGTDLPGVPHRYRVARLYRQWLKLALCIPRSGLVDINQHTQMNERALVILRQRFREGALVRDPDRIRILVYDCERSLSMMRELSQDCARRRFPSILKRPNFFNPDSVVQLAKANMKGWIQEWFNVYVRRQW